MIIFPPFPAFMIFMLYPFYISESICSFVNSCQLSAIKAFSRFFFLLKLRLESLKNLSFSIFGDREMDVADCEPKPASSIIFATSYFGPVNLDNWVDIYFVWDNYVIRKFKPYFDPPQACVNHLTSRDQIIRRKMIFVKYTRCKTQSGTTSKWLHQLNGLKVILFLCASPKL